ncbi:TetR/AcrR family transcriptional regulator [Mycobacteroides salmoniphilum]|uniref:TetR/AcrR family transcriptional regulator n=1 Tax=Mycobacteroides salmoniphilum TaxID=404941 RepID=UPI0009922FC2|nr:TetR/AcrR family transcriptional regulator [Mycobacteroides salmoniphilum]
MSGTRGRRRHSDDYVRVSRVERVEAMRLRLLDATLWCIADKGYAATSTNDVVRRAGVSRGALAHHFPTKAALVNAAASQLVAHRAVYFQERLASLTPEERTPAAALEILWSLYEEPECRALTELSIAARHDAELRALMRSWDDTYLEVLLTASTEFFPELAAKPDAALLLRSVTALYDGLGLYDLTREDARKKAAEVRGFFTELLTRREPAIGEHP